MRRQERRDAGPLGLLIVLALVLFLLSKCDGGEMEFNQGFTVLANSNARKILIAASKHRKDIEEEWGLAATGPATITWTDSKDDTAFTWERTGKRKYHAVYLRTTLERATGSTLKHEIAHVVAAGRLPLWANEGLASMYDDPLRKKIRREQPNMRPLQVLSLRSVTSATEYANCERLVAMLVGVKGKKEFVKFAQDCVRHGTESALLVHYNLTLKELGQVYLGEKE